MTAGLSFSSHTPWPKPNSCVPANPSDGFGGVDCSDGTCDGCGGVFGFAYESTATEILESGDSVTLTLVRLAGTDGDMVVTVDDTRGNMTQGLDYGGTWPTEVRHVCGPGIFRRLCWGRHHEFPTLPGKSVVDGEIKKLPSQTLSVSFRTQR